MNTTYKKKRGSLVLLIIGVVLVLNSTHPIQSVLAQQPAGEAEGGGQVTREEKQKADELKQLGQEVDETGTVTPKASEAEGAGRVTRQQQVPTPAESPKGSITPYGRVELDAIYSNRNTNPLDPGQFNGYLTAAGKSSNSSSTFNPRYSVFGIRAARTGDVHTLKGVVEIDFYGETDNAGNLPPRLRLANASYAYKRTSLTVGQDWTPVMALHPDLIDFSIMGYGGNLWQRLPQVTVRHGFTDNIEGLLTVFRFERGLSAIQPYTQRKPFTGHGAGAFTGACGPPFFGCSENAFNDPVKMPYAGARLAYGGTGSLQGLSIAVSAAYRYYRSAPISPAATSLTGVPLLPSGSDINSYVVGGELVVPITNKVKFSAEIAYGQALDVEFFRYAQSRNLTTGQPVRTVLGWAQLSYVHSSDFTFLAGYGFDNPLNSDLAGAAAGGIPADQQYLVNQRTYLSGIYHVWADFYTGVEWNHVWTEWSNGEKFNGDNYMVSFWYNF